MELFRQLDDGQTDKQTNGLTELFLKLLSRLKIEDVEFIKIQRLEKSDSLVDTAHCP